MNEQGVKIKPELGLVCITTSEAVRYRTITRKRLLEFDEATQREKLRELYAANLERFNNAITYCQENGIRLYRLTSGLFPFADESFGMEVLHEIKDELAAAGERANQNGLRVVLHP